MTTYEDFRVRLNPDVAEPGRWSVVVRRSPLASQVGKQASVVPLLTRADLQRLRSRNGWPNIGALRQIGDAVWRSVLQGEVGAAFSACLDVLSEQNKCLRLVLVVQGQEHETADPTLARLAELPIEALYSDQLQFIATDLNTPISRSLQDEADREPEQITLPLRVLVVVAAPVDKPPADAAAEEAALRDAIAEFDPTASAIKVDVVQQATRDTFRALSRKRYDVVHFIGHGGFDIVGDDPTPRAHICLVRPDGTERSDIVDADTLETILRNTTVRLAIFTACSTSAPAPDADPYTISAFEGVAQRLVSGVSGVTAAVAMQFDLESDAAVEFTRSFYEQLVRPDISLDEAVTVARKRLATRLDAGHRAWVTPTVLWRCKAARVFLTDPSHSELDPDVAAELQAVDITLRILRDQIDRINHAPAQDRPALTGLLESLRSEMRDLQTQRGDLLGESVRLHGATADAGAEVHVPIWLRTRISGSVSLLRLDVEYPAAKLTFVDAKAGADSAGVPAVALNGDSGLSVVVQPPAGDASWAVGHREVGVLRFRVHGALEPQIVDVRITAATLTRDGRESQLRPVDGVLFVDQPDAPAE